MNILYNAFNVSQCRISDSVFNIINCNQYRGDYVFVYNYALPKIYSVLQYSDVRIGFKIYRKNPLTKG